MNLQALRDRLSSLEAQIRAVQKEGEILTDCWLDSAPGGSGALGGQTILIRLRWMKEGKKKCRTLKPEEIAGTRAAIARGVKLTKLQKDLEQTKADLEKAEIRAQQLKAELERLGVA